MRLTPLLESLSVRSPSPYLLLVVPPLMWSGNFVFGRGMHDLIPPLAFSFWRWMIALFALALFTGPALWKNRHRIYPHWKIYTLLGLFGVTAYNTLVYLAFHHTTAINGVMINSTVPLHVLLFAWLIYGRRPRPQQLVAVLLSLLGIALIMTKADLGRLLELEFNWGDLLILLAAFSWAIYSLLLQKRPTDVTPLVSLTAIMVIGIVPLLPAYLWELADGRSFPLRPDTAGVLLYVGVFASVIAYIFWNRGVSEAGPAAAALFVHLMPLFTTVFAILFLGESLHAYHGWGALAIASGIYLATRAERQKAVRVSVQRRV